MSEIREGPGGRGQKVLSQIRCEPPPQKKNVSSSHAGGGPTGTRIQSMLGYSIILTHCGRVTKICVFNTVKLGTSASSS
jgi:hypothetical protein